MRVQNTKNVIGNVNGNTELIVDFLFCCVVFLAAFLLQNNLQNLCTTPENFRKLIFSLKTLKIGKFL